MIILRPFMYRKHLNRVLWKFLYLRPQFSTIFEMLPFIYFLYCTSFVTCLLLLLLLLIKNMWMKCFYWTLYLLKTYFHYVCPHRYFWRNYRSNVWGQCQVMSPYLRLHVSLKISQKLVIIGLYLTATHTRNVL